MATSKICWLNMYCGINCVNATDYLSVRLDAGLLHDDWRTGRKAKAFGGVGAKSKTSFQVSR